MIINDESDSLEFLSGALCLRGAHIRMNSRVCDLLGHRRSRQGTSPWLST